LATDIIIPDTVLKLLNDMPKEVRLKFWEQIERLVRNPAYPSLRSEKLSGTDQWAFSITMNYRATYLLTERGIVITAVGTHKDVLGN
jgi:mRNA-degrading endonuclease RelE of RelBE toxin-antitoxin system